MTTEYSSPDIGLSHSHRSYQTSTSCNRDLTEEITDHTEILSFDKSSKKVTICTLCGRYRGFRMPRYLFIILCIALALLILLIAAIIVFYAVIPAIISSTMAKAELGFRNVSIEQIQTTSFRLRAQLELSNTGSISATILAPFIIHVDDVGTITNNQDITIAGGSTNSTIVPIDSSFTVTNPEAFNKFSRSLIFQSNVVWHLKAEATIRPISSHMISYSNIPFNKEVKLNALNGLQNVSIDSIRLNGSNADQIIVDLIIKIQNPSIFSIDLGRLFFFLEYNNFSIGYVKSKDANITIHSGENAIPFCGELQSTSSESYNAISVIINNYLTNQTSHVTALAGQNATSYPLLAAGMTGLSLGARMPPFNEQLIASLNFSSMSLIPSASDKTVALSASIIIKINSPLGPQSPLNITSMNMNVSLIYENNSVGILNVLQATVTRLDPMTYQAEFDNKYLILDGTGATYEKFAQAFINASNTSLINFRIGGVASVIGSFALGPLNIDGILVENNVTLVGLDGLNNVHVDGISVDGEEGDALRLLINTTIENPSLNIVQLQHFSLYMAEAENGTILGQVPIDVLALQPGINQVSLNGLLAPLYERDLPVVGKFFSAYLNGQTQSVKLFHNESSGDNTTAMDLTISGLSMKANLDGIQAQLIRQVNVLNFGIEFDPDDVNKVYVTGRLSVLFQLPSNVNMTFKALTTSIDFVMRFNNGPAMGRIILLNLPVQHNQTTNELLMSFEKQELILLNKTAFEDFAANVVLKPDVLVAIEGLASALVQIRIGNITLTDIPVNQEVKLTALNGLQNVSIDSISLNRSDAHRIIVDLIIKIQNPSIFGVDLGRLFFSLKYNNCSIGYVESNNANVTLRSGENAIPFFGELQSTSSESYNAISAIINNFLTDKISHVAALAGRNATSYPLLAPAMTGLILDTPMPPFNEQLITSLNFSSMSLIPSMSDKTVTLSASIIIKINSPLGPQSPLNIESMNMNVSLIYENNSVGILNIPQVPVKQLDAMTYQAEFDNKYLILDGAGAAYEKFAQAFINASNTSLINFRIGGVASVIGSFALGPLNIDGIHVENNVTLVGLDGLNNVHVDGISVDGEEGDALRLSINTTIQNPGITIVQLQHFSLYMAEAENGTILGQVPIDVLALQPGINQVSLNGLLAPLYERDLPVVGKFFSAYLNGQTQSVKLFHNESSGDNTTAMDLTISGLSMKANLDGIETKLIRQVNVLNFGIEFDSDDVNRVYVTGRLSVLFQLPSNVNMTFKALTTSINFVMRFNNGPAMGRIILLDLPVQHNQTTNELLMSFEKQELKVLNTTAFQEFAASLVLTTDVSVVIEGLASALAQIRIGNITLTDIPVNDTLQLVGYNQFNNGLLRIDDIDIVGAISSQALALQVKTEITNPSVVNIINGGRLLLVLRDAVFGASLGLVIIDPFFLDPKGNATIINAGGIFNITEHNADIAKQFISNMVSGIDSEVELRGTLDDNSTGTSIPLLSLAIAGLHIHTKIPGLSGEKALAREIRVKKLTAAEIAGITIGLVKRIFARIRLSNPFSASMTIHSMDVKIYYGPIIDDAKHLGLVNDHTPLYISPHQELLSSYLNVTIDAKLTTLVELIGPLLAGNARLSLNGFIDVTIGDDFVLNQVPVTMLNITTGEEAAYEE